jgi:hypothetical protein
MALTFAQPPAGMPGRSPQRGLQSALGPDDRAGAAIPWSWTFRLVAIACLFGCQVIHAAVIQPHLVEWLPAGFFFLGLSLVEGLLGLGLLLTPSRSVCRITVAVTAATLTLWAVSRGAGLPFGPGAFQAEAIGRPDFIATLLELIRLGALLALVRGPQPAGASSPSRRMRCLAGGAVLVAVTALTAIGVKGINPHHHGAALPGITSQSFR